MFCLCGCCCRSAFPNVEIPADNEAGPASDGSGGVVESPLEIAGSASGFGQGCWGWEEEEEQSAKDDSSDGDSSEFMRPTSPKDKVR